MDQIANYIVSINDADMNLAICVGPLLGKWATTNHKIYAFVLVEKLIVSVGGVVNKAYAPTPYEVESNDMVGPCWKH